VYCNTIPYTVDQYLQLLGIAIPFGITATLFRILTVLVVIGALYLMYRQPKNISLMLKLIFAVLIVITAFSQYRSPQYIVWFTPFAALLVASDIRGILLFIGVQVLAYIEYPLVYGVLYVNDTYVSGWGLVFFTVFFLMIGLLLWRALKMEGPDLPIDNGAVKSGKAAKGGGGFYRVTEKRPVSMSRVDAGRGKTGLCRNTDIHAAVSLYLHGQMPFQTRCFSPGIFYFPVFDTVSCNGYYRIPDRIVFKNGAF